MVEDFPLVFDQSVDPVREILGGTFIDSDFDTHWMIPFEFKIHEDAQEDEQQIEVMILPLGETDSPSEKKFNITIEDVRTVFDITIKDFKQSTITFDILNRGENDAEALTIDIPKQENIRVFGNSREIIGGLDSGDDTTFSFEANPKEGQIKLIIIYLDEIGEIRTIEKNVEYDPTYFAINPFTQQASVSPFMWLFILLIVLIIAYIIYSRIKKKNRKKELNI